MRVSSFSSFFSHHPAWLLIREFDEELPWECFLKKLFYVVPLALGLILFFISMGWAQSNDSFRSPSVGQINTQRGTGNYRTQNQSAGSPYAERNDTRSGDQRTSGVQTTVAPPGYSAANSDRAQNSPQSSGQTPRLQPADSRNQPPRTARAPFLLTPAQEAELNQFLTRWEKYGDQMERFECEFNCFHFRNAILPAVKNDKPADPNAPTYTTFGKIKFASPDKGLYEVSGEWIDDKRVGGRKRMKLVCNGDSVFEYKFGDQEVVEFPLSEEQKGSSIQNGPIPFVFGAKAEDLKRRYFLRLITPPQQRGRQIWLEVWPRWREDADEFRNVQMILDAETLKPIGMQKFDTNGKTRSVYQFSNVEINPRNLKEFLLGDPFTAKVPFGWKKRTDNALLEQPQVSRQPQNGSSYK
jgi:TIGR03009 family protein